VLLFHLKVGLNRDRIGDYKPRPISQVPQVDVFSESNVKAALRRALESRDVTKPVSSKPVLGKPSNDDAVLSRSNAR